MRRYKMTASFFGLCGIFAVPALLSSGQAPVMSVALGRINIYCGNKAADVVTDLLFLKLAFLLYRQLFLFIYIPMAM